MNGPPFRAEHVGSLLRPAALTAAFRAWSAGDIDATGFRRVQDECIREVAALEEGVGLRVVTDGEFRRASYWGHFLGPVAGLGTGEAVYRFRDEAGAESSFLAPRVEGRVRRRESIGGPAFSFSRRRHRRHPQGHHAFAAHLPFLAGAGHVRSRHVRRFRRVLLRARGGLPGGARRSRRPLHRHSRHCPGRASGPDLPPAIRNRRTRPTCNGSWPAPGSPSCHLMSRRRTTMRSSVFSSGKGVPPLRRTISGSHRSPFGTTWFCALPTAISGTCRKS